ncbi:hypothetical protein FLL45_12145 [Aliikangiella marina]|uniref:Exo-alpha-sialidase n=1 Tax=Aliikangiella marina TaxID=1712262 RepID=A0A545T8W4_9GAMM|nr:PD40 domain-containing protein [Aliikangiella marina]TQV73618.1 hypothetical protein FLL45_12145 [Aliikangiella marina]
MTSLANWVSALFLLGSTVQAATMPYALTEEQTQAVKFAPGIISTSAHFEINSVFNASGDKVLFARCSDDFKQCTMMESDYIDGSWQTPKALPFSGGYLEADPYYSPNYEYVYFVSKRPINHNQAEAKSVNLWRVRLSDGTWGEPEYLKQLSSTADDLYPSLTSNGDLYFPSFRNNQRLLYVARATASGFTKPTPLPDYMFGEGGKIGDSVVLKDGNTIIFSMRRADSLGKGDLYISFKKGDRWSIAKSLGNKVNTPDHEFTPIVSPDGQYLFFTRIENGRGNIYQIALKAIIATATE